MHRKLRGGKKTPGSGERRLPEARVEAGGLHADILYGVLVFCNRSEQRLYGPWASGLPSLFLYF